MIIIEAVCLKSIKVESRTYTMRRHLISSDVVIEKSKNQREIKP